MLFKKSSAKATWAWPISLFAVIVSIASLLFPLLPSPNTAAAEAAVKPMAPQATVIAEYDFDDGTEQGWVARTDTVTTTVEAVTDTYRSAAYSLKVTGRSQGWHSGSIDVLSLLEVGATYTISGCTRLVAGETPTRTIFHLQCAE